MPVSKRPKPLIGFTRLSNAELLVRGRLIHDLMLDDPKFTNSPVKLADFKEALDRFAAAMAATLDGSKASFVLQDQERANVMLLMIQIGNYVDDMAPDEATIVSAGFEVAPSSYSTPQPLSRTEIIEILQGLTGQLLVRIRPLGRKALRYELRYAAQDSMESPDAWITIHVSSARKPVAVDGLTPAKVYTFQVRAYGAAGFTDWSDIVTRMCI